MENGKAPEIPGAGIVYGETEYLKEEAPEVPVTGIIYGEIAYWVALLGILIAIVGIIIYMVYNGYVNLTCSLNELWRGASVDAIWSGCAGVIKTPEGHWYLSKLSYGDGIAMLGIAVSCSAAVLGMWGGLFGMVRSKGGMYIVFALIIAIILTLAAAGLIVIKE
jgi:hypothetical protein